MKSMNRKFGITALTLAVVAVVAAFPPVGRAQVISPQCPTADCSPCPPTDDCSSTKSPVIPGGFLGHVSEPGLQAAFVNERTVLVGWRDWFKSPAQKATDADKIAFLKRESAFSADMADGGSMTSLGNAAFQRLAKVYNEQWHLLKYGFVPVSAQDGLRLTAIQNSVNENVLTMQNECLSYVGQVNALLRAVPQADPSSVNNLSCDFIRKADFAEKSGRSYFASPSGTSLLQAMNTAKNPRRKLLAIQMAVNGGINEMKRSCLSYMSNTTAVEAASGVAGALAAMRDMASCRFIHEVRYVERTDDGYSYRPTIDGENILAAIGE